jgi:hypothetical protein
MPADLSVLLRDAADDVPIAAPDLDAVAGVARQRTRIARVRAGAVVTVVAAIALAASSVRTTGDETDVASSPPTTSSTGRAIVAFANAALDERIVVFAPADAPGAGRIASIRGSEVDVVGEAPTSHGDFPHPVLNVGDRLVWSDGTTAWSSPADLHGQLERVGEASFLVPAVEADRVWLVDGGRAMVEVTVDGLVTDELALDAATWPIREVETGMLVDVGGRVAVLGERGELGPTFPGVAVAASATHVVTGAGTIADVRSGDLSGIGVPGWTFAEPALDVAFSNDGRRLAYLTGPSGTRLAALVVVDLGSGEVVQRARLQSVDHPGRLRWSPQDDALYLLDLRPSTVDGARRVIGVPAGGAPQTVARFGSGGAGYHWLAVADDR